MAMLQLLPNGKLLLASAGKLAIQCCCEPSVCINSTLIADFSWVQNDCEPPFCLDFQDESTPSDGCPIISWEWDFGDGQTSTAQNPTHCYDGAGSYDVTLQVTDVCGCTKSVTRTVDVGDCDCIGMGPCACMLTGAPSLTVAVSGNFGLCLEAIGTHALLQRPDTCHWQKDSLPNPFDPANVQWIVQIFCLVSGQIRVTFSYHQSGSSLTLSRDFSNLAAIGISPDGSDCSGFSVLFTEADIALGGNTCLAGAALSVAITL